MDKYPTYGHRPSSANRHVDLLGAAGTRAVIRRTKHPQHVDLSADSNSRDPLHGMLASEQLAQLLFGDDGAPSAGASVQLPSSGTVSVATINAANAAAKRSRSLALLALSPSASAKALFNATMSLNRQQQVLAEALHASASAPSLPYQGSVRSDSCTPVTTLRCSHVVLVVTLFFR